MADYPAPRRLSFPDEGHLSWLAPLLDPYHIIDQGVQEGVGREERQGRRLACANGCSACCRLHLTIPVYPLELMGLYLVLRGTTEGSCAWARC